MILFKTITDTRKWLDDQVKNGRRIGFVPTMGALHPGHISLVETAKQGNEKVVCSIFVNPVQFNDPMDFQKYPISIEKDIELLESSGCDLLFLPSVKEMYPAGLKQQKHYQIGWLETVLEGKFRPGHFQGVCQAVHRLLEIITPDNLYLGQKDYQQCMVIKRLVELIGMENKVRVNIGATIREKDGLAMSSRNRRLNEEERKKALAIYQTLQFIKSSIHAGELTALKANAVFQLTHKGYKVDYVEIADAETLMPVENWDGNQNLVCLAAAYLNEVRLIDNILLQ